MLLCLPNSSCKYIFSLILQLRLTIGKIYNSCGARKGCPLAFTIRPPLPADITSTGITNFYENLEDITIFIPELVERSDDLCLLLWDEAHNTQFELICAQYRHFTTKLSTWYAHLYEIYPTPFWDEPGHTPHNRDYEFGPSYQFLCFWVAQALMHYWGVRILLYDALAQALQWKHNLPFTTRTAAPNQHYPSVFELQLGQNQNQDQPQSSISQHILDTTILTSLVSSTPAKAYNLIRHAQYSLATNIRKSLHYIWSSDLGTCSTFRTANATVLASRVFESLVGCERQVKEEEGSEYFENFDAEREDARKQLQWMESVKRHYEIWNLAIRELSDIVARDWRSMLEGNVGGR